MLGSTDGREGLSEGRLGEDDDWTSGDRNRDRPGTKGKEGRKRREEGKRGREKGVEKEGEEMDGGREKDVRVDE